MSDGLPEWEVISKHAGIVTAIHCRSQGTALSCGIDGCKLYNRLN